MELLNELHLKKIFMKLRNNLLSNYKRVLPFGEYFTDRWEKSKFLEFGEGSSVYDSCYVYGDVKVGEHTWIGPFTILDGSGGLRIGSFCSISAGVHIYTHDSVKWAISGGKTEYEYESTTIGNNCYIGPNTIISKGVFIGDRSIIGANSFVGSNLPAGSKAVGNPCRIISFIADSY